MKDLLDLLSDGHARTQKLLAIELHTTTEDVKRQIEYLEHIGVIRRVDASCCSKGCGGDCGKCEYSVVYACYLRFFGLDFLNERKTVCGIYYGKLKVR
ncbi:hypothetical protein [Butyrivibrio sp. JL13D10]|uniref:hypothetical protein n=1 Tax=Butyrivibrio sp. JL13D10 TaxID=3236815 RepID=UPI0038B625B1